MSMNLEWRSKPGHSTLNRIYYGNKEGEYSSALLKNMNKCYKLAIEDNTNNKPNAQPFPINHQEANSPMLLMNTQNRKKDHNTKE